MRLKTPKYINVEDKIVGPRTLKQLLYTLVGIGILFFFWQIFTIVPFVIIAIPIVAAFGFIGFYRYNGQPFANLFGSFLGYMMKPKLYIWKKDDKQS